MFKKLGTIIQYGKIVRPIHIIIDLVFVNLVSLLVALSFMGSNYFEQSSLPFILGFVVSLSWLLPAIFMGVYFISRTIQFSQLLRLLVKTYFLYAFFILFFLWLLDISFSRFQIGLTIIMSCFVLSISQFSMLVFKRYMRSSGRNLRSVVMIGYGDLSRYLFKKLYDKNEYGYNFLGYFDDKHRGELSLGGISDVIPYLKEHKVKMIYCYPVYVDPKELAKIVDWAEDNLIKVNIIPDYRGYQYNNMEIEMIGDIPVLKLTPLPLEDIINRMWKRLFDLFVSFWFFVFVFWWLLPVVAILIKLESRGPVFFKQPRGGRGNEPFYIYKFRTMVVHDSAKVKQATRHDSRITKIGSILRKTSIDELPQFINVFLGQMSFVGPRPHALQHNEDFRETIDRFNERHAVKPGLTGLAQAKGFRGEIATHQDLSNRIKMDKFYVKHWSFLLDVRIILLTIRSMMRGQDTAY